MAAHTSIFAWRIPWTEEPGGLQSMDILRRLYDHAQGVSGPSSSCVWNPRVFADDARGPAPKPDTTDWSGLLPAAQMWPQVLPIKTSSPKCGSFSLFVDFTPKES